MEDIKQNEEKKFPNNNFWKIMINWIKKTKKQKKREKRKKEEIKNIEKNIRKIKSSFEKDRWSSSLITISLSL